MAQVLDALSGCFRLGRTAGRCLIPSFDDPLHLHFVDVCALQPRVAESVFVHEVLARAPRSCKMVQQSLSVRELTEWPAAEVGDWFVLRTRARQEKILAQDLAARSIFCFLPLIRTVRYYGEHKARVEVPLFAGYLFLRGSVDDAYTADRTQRVAQIIDVADQSRLDAELRSLYLALRNVTTLDPYPYLKQGVHVEVRSGPFRGIQGVVESRARMNLLVLQVEMLGRAVSLEIDPALLEVIDAPGVRQTPAR